MLGTLTTVLLAASCPQGQVYPADDFVDRTADAKLFRPDAVQALEDYAFTLTGADEDRKGLRTDAVVILKNGELVYERYARGWEASKRHIGWSVTKTFTNTLTGVAVAHGAVDVDEHLCTYLKLDAPEACAQVTLRHLLEFSSGFDWKELYENQSNQESSTLAMLYGVGHADMANFVARHALRDPPGTTYMYSTGESALLLSTVNAAMRPRFGAEWPWTLLFEPLGMKSVVLERDAAGGFSGGSHLYATARDYARYGLFWLHDGCWNGKRILPEGWAAQSKQISQGFKMKPLERDDGEVYAWQWTVNTAVPEVGQVERPFKTLPATEFAARGHWGQSVTVLPEQGVVIVRLADDRESGFDFEKFVNLALAVTP